MRVCLCVCVCRFMCLSYVSESAWLCVENVFSNLILCVRLFGCVYARYILCMCLCLCVCVTVCLCMYVCMFDRVCVRRYVFSVCRRVDNYFF